MRNLPAKCNLIITGVGGQGNVLAARLLAEALLIADIEAVVGDVYGLSQRGGSVASHVRWKDNTQLPPLVPRGRLDILVAFEPMEGLRVLSQFGSKTTRALVNETPILPIGAQAGHFEYPDLKLIWQSLQAGTTALHTVKATDTALNLGNIMVLNIVMIGALTASGLLGKGSIPFEDAIQTSGSVSQQYVDLNLRAFEEGKKLITTKTDRH